MITLWQQSPWDLGRTTINQSVGNMTFILMSWRYVTCYHPLKEMKLSGVFALLAVTQDAPVSWKPSPLSVFLTCVVSNCWQQQRTSACKMYFLDLQTLKTDHSKRKRSKSELYQVAYHNFCEENSWCKLRQLVRPEDPSGIWESSLKKPFKRNTSFGLNLNVHSHQKVLFRKSS